MVTLRDLRGPEDLKDISDAEAAALCAEIRTANQFDIKLLANNPAWWAKALASVTEVREDWKGETPPSGITIG